MATKVTRSLKEINSEVKNLDQNLGKLRRENADLNKSLKLDSSNITLVAERTKNLQQQASLAAQKVTILKNEQMKMAHAVKSGQATAEEYRKLSIEVGKAEAQVKGLNAQLRASSGISLDKLQTSLTKVSRAATVVLGAIVGISLKMSEVGDVISDASERYRISAENFQKNKIIFDRTTGDAESYARALDEVQRQLGAAQKGSAKAVKSFEMLGISLDEVKGLGAAEALDLIMSKLAEITDLDERANIASALLTSTGVEVAQVAGLTAEEYDKLANSIASTQIITQEEADSAAAMKDKIDDVKASASKLGMEFMTALLPLLYMLLNVFYIIIGVAKEVAGGFGSMSVNGQKFAGIALITLILLPKLITLIKGVGTAITFISKAMTLMGANPLNAKIMLICVAVAALILLLIELKKRLDGTFNKEYSLDIDSPALGIDTSQMVGDVSAIQKQISSQMVVPVSTTTTNYYDNSTMNNTIEYEADIEDIADQLSTKIRVGGK